MKNIGLTTTVPIEVLISAGYSPMDLNNVFVTSDNHLKYIELAERDGFPKSMCAWIKGLYGVCMQHQISEILGVIEGDCSNSKALVDLWASKGATIYPFSFPQSRKKEEIELEINQLMDLMNVDIHQVEKVRQELNQIRELAHEIDRLTYQESRATGFENHLYQVSCSDFNGDVSQFREQLKSTIEEMKIRKPQKKNLRLGYIGVPPMTADLYAFVEEFDASIIYNEVQREFTFPRAKEAHDIYEQYADYTYPYDSTFRIEEIKKQMKERSLDGLIHYTQAFCHRAIDDIIIKEALHIPILNIEGDQANVLDARTKLRLEAFLDMLSDRKGNK